ncbi:molybdenum ABC transporter ATP-binding protein [Pasteurellaceae bacterium RH1A]|nr:molybdenum ABC transporter ATP-binding protein [Pasteurellaceae bacterium RH1A]
MLKLNLQKQLGNLTLSADLSIPNIGVTAIFGLSGAGKSSLINLVSGLSQPDQGRIELNGRVLFDSQTGINLPPEKRNIGYVFQDARLFPHYTVKGNLGYGMAKSAGAKFDQVVELLGIGHLLKRYPVTLSGGEKQRVAIGRALLREPELLLMDEPLSALDIPRKRELLDYLERLTQSLQIPILYVSHSLEELQSLAQQVILMEQGRVVAFDRLESLWNSPLFAAWQEGEEATSLLNLPVRGQNEIYQMTELAFGSQSLWVKGLHEQGKTSLRVCIQGSDVAISLTPPQQTSIRNNLRAEIAQVRPQADKIDLKLASEGLSFWASISPWAYAELGLAEGQAVYAQIKSLALLR